MAPRSKSERAARLPRELYVHVPPLLNQPLDDAYNVFKTAILPRSHIEELNAQDITKAGEALAVWEQSEEISGKYTTESSKNLVDEMLHVIEYIVAHPGVSDLNISSLQDRCKALQRRIYLILLNEHLDKKGNRDVATVVSEWTAEIESHILNSGSHDLKWYAANFTKILGLLEASSQINTNPQAVLTLRKLLEAAYIPHFDHLKVVYEMLAQSNSLDGSATTTYTARLSDALDLKNAPEYTRANLQNRIESIRNACQARDFSTVQTLTDYFEALPKTKDEAVLASVKLVLEQSALDIVTNIPDQQNLSNKLYSISKKIQDAFSNLSTALRPSLYPRDSTNTLKITFRDISLDEGAPYVKHVDRRKYDDLVLDASPTEPIQGMLSRFVEEINLKNRHPFFPISDFDLKVTRQPEIDSPELTLHVGKNWFNQGKVADVLSGSTFISYTRRDGLQDLQEYPPVFRILWPQQRQYPISAPQPPSHWIQTPTAAGPWQEVSTLQFMGDGAELTAYATYPPLIARTLVLPRRFGTITTASILLRRFRMSPTLLGMKLAFPLTVDQARSILGHTILYQSADPGVKSTERRLPHNKRRKVEEDSDPVYMAFVWGLDLDAKIIKTVEFANELSGELIRTFKFDNSETPLPTFLQPDSLPDDYPPIMKLATFDWIGLVEFPTPVSPPENAEAAEKEIERKRKRFSDILAAAPPFFQIGIEGDRALVIGDLNQHLPGTPDTLTVEGCKLGIWESGYREMEGPNDTELLIWVQWKRAGAIDLSAPASAFSRPATQNPAPLPSNVVWQDQGSVSTDAATMAILARGILRESSIEAITGRRDHDGYLQRLVLSGSEDGKYHIPGGISSYTGGDGNFLVQVAKNDQGDIVAVRVTGNGSLEDES